VNFYVETRNETQPLVAVAAPVRVIDTEIKSKALILVLLGEVAVVFVPLMVTVKVVSTPLIRKVTVQLLVAKGAFNTRTEKLSMVPVVDTIN
jgi:hypothetical protein